MTLEREKYVPLSVRYGGRRKKLGWWVGTQREKLALRLAPWLRPPQHVHTAPPRMVRCLCPRNPKTGERIRTHDECRVHSVPNATWQAGNDQMSAEEIRDFRMQTGRYAR